MATYSNLREQVSYIFAFSKKNVRSLSLALRRAGVLTHPPLSLGNFISFFGLSAYRLGDGLGDRISYQSVSN